jgi:hypothetical protein
MAEPLSLLTTAVVGSIALSVVDAVSGLPVSTPQVALARQLPSSAQLGTLSRFDLGQVTIDGSVKALSPGAWVKSEMNSVLMPGMLSGTHRVKYETDAQGYIARVWLLNAAEIAELD